MNYSLHQLDIFLKVIELQSISKAAEALYLTQPAVSIQMKNFQDQFRLPLFHITGRKFFVTEFGAEVARSARRIKEETKAIEVSENAYMGLLVGKLHISSVSTGKYIIPYYLSEFLRIHPTVGLELNVTNKNKVVDNIRKNEVDFGLISVDVPDLEYRSLELFQNILHFVGNESIVPHQGKSTVEMFQEYPIILREQGSGTRALMEQFMSTHRIVLRNKLELSSDEAVKQAIVAGLGYSIMPLIGLKNELQLHQLHVLKLEGLPILTHWKLVWNPKRVLTPVASAFVRYLEDRKQHVKETYFHWQNEYSQVF